MTATNANAWPKEPLSTIVVPAQKAVLAVHSSTKVSAPASVVFSTLLDYPAYTKWCTWTPKGITIRSQPSGDATSTDDHVLKKGTHFSLQVMMDPQKPDSLSSTDLYVTDISTPKNPSSYISPNGLREGNFTPDPGKVYRISWAGEGAMAWLIQSERFHEVIVTGEEACEVRSWECFKGVMARVVKMMYQASLMDGFRRWVEDLRRESERRFEEIRARHHGGRRG